MGYDDVYELQRLIAPVLKRLYPANPDVVIGREAREIAVALVADGWSRSQTGHGAMTTVF